MGGVKYNPVSEAGVDDTIEPSVEFGKQVFKKITATAKNPVPLNLKGLGLGGAAGVVTESTIKQLLDATRGGKPNENQFLANIEKLGTRMVGGATSGAIYGKNPASAIGGAIGGAALDTGDNLIQSGVLASQAINDLSEARKMNLQKDKIEKEMMQKRIQENLKKPLDI